jgi:hypothetical protein
MYRVSGGSGARVADRGQAGLGPSAAVRHHDKHNFYALLLPSNPPLQTLRCGSDQRRLQIKAASVKRHA